jgi:hypothetical protein
MAQGEWCLVDNHGEYERDPDLNEWLDGGDDDALAVLDQFGLNNVLTPSKALFAGDSLSYEQERSRFRAERRSRALGDGLLDEHWVGCNRARFRQLLDPILAHNVAAFVGAGISCSANFPSWAGHLLHQARTAGIDEADVLDAVKCGEHEQIIARIVSMRSEEVFLQELRDQFRRDADELSLVRKIVAMVPGLIVTTNYDCSIEDAVVQAEGGAPSTLTGALSSNQTLVAHLSNRRRCILKVHGSIIDPASCILTEAQYDSGYGPGAPDLSLPLPRKLRLLYEQRTLLFLGCSLETDRPLSVFSKVREESGPENVPQHFAIVEAPEDLDLPRRNAELLALGITPIFYPAGRHHVVPALLDELLIELKAVHGGMQGARPSKYASLLFEGGLPT